MLLLPRQAIVLHFTAKLMEFALHPLCDGHNESADSKTNEAPQIDLVS